MFGEDSGIFWFGVLVVGFSMVMVALALLLVIIHGNGVCHS